MLMFDFGGLKARVCNISITDGEAEELIEAAVIAAGEDVRARAWTARRTEQHLMSVQRERDLEQQALAEGNRLANERERQVAEARQEALRAAENGPQRSGW